MLARNTALSTQNAPEWRSRRGLAGSEELSLCVAANFRRMHVSRIDMGFSDQPGHRESLALILSCSRSIRNHRLATSFDVN
jgi:hypothetical protein